MFSVTRTYFKVIYCKFFLKTEPKGYIVLFGQTEQMFDRNMNVHLILELLFYLIINVKIIYFIATIFDKAKR